MELTLFVIFALLTNSTQTDNFLKISWAFIVVLNCQFSAGWLVTDIMTE